MRPDNARTTRTGNGGAHTYITNMTAPKPNSPVSAWVDLEKIEKVLQAAHEEIGQLEERLASVLSPAPPGTAAVAGPTDSSVSTLTQHSRRCVDTATALCERLQALRQRVEL